MDLFPIFPDLSVTSTEDIVSRDVQCVYDYWLSNHGQNGPRWEDVELMDLHKLAPNIMVKEYVDDIQNWRNRFFGTGLSRILGVEGTAKLLPDYHSTENATKACQFFSSIRNEKVPVRVHGQ